MRKRTLVAALAVGLLALALIGGAVLAQTSDEDDDKAGKSFAARVAEILDLEEADVEAAMEQARADMLDEQLDAHIDRLVERGVLTEEQAEEYRTWLDDRPDDLPQLGGRGWGKGRHGFCPRPRKIRPRRLGPIIRRREQRRYGLRQTASRLKRFSLTRLRASP